MMHENLDLSDINQVLHVVRNPYGWNEHVVRDARLKLADEFERLRAEVDALRADAERYRWLRNDAKNTDVTQPIVVRGYDGPAGNYFNEPLWDDELDAAIDAARTGE
jgi:hypothetical protein